MADINQVSITGNIGKAPEIKYFESGSCIVNFSVAIKEWAGQKKGEQTIWVDCKAWNKKAQFIAEYSKSGSFVALGGRLAVDNYKAQDGTNRVKTYINVEEIRIIDKR